MQSPRIVHKLRLFMMSYIIGVILNHGTFRHIQKLCRHSSSRVGRWSCRVNEALGVNAGGGDGSNCIWLQQENHIICVNPHY